VARTRGRLEENGPRWKSRMGNMTDFLEEAKTQFPYTQALRRDLHAHPELGFREVRTSGIVARELESLGLEVRKGVGKTGVVALLDGASRGSTLLLRFDMDALPIQEETGAAYASTVAGVMHACGHDGHTAIGLTVAKLLAAHRADLVGTLKLCFQPSEEGFNGEEFGGNQMMILDGVLEGPHVDRTLALHLWNDKPLGWACVAGGPVMASADLFTVRLTGKGGHGASPHLTIDPVVASAQIISALQTITSRNVSPLESAVVSVTTVHSGTGFNVIPPEAELTGTIRTFDPGVSGTVLKRFDEIIRAVAGGMGCDVAIEVRRFAPATINDAATAARVQETARMVLPTSELQTSGYVTMGAEDMAFMQEQVPGCYVFLGSSNKERHLDFGHHHPKFDFDEEALPRAAALMAAAAIDLQREVG
jgi:amidohydrolase